MLRRLMMAGAAVAPAYTTLNPADKAANVTLSGGNLVASMGTANSGFARAVHGKSSGKHYFEAVVAQNGSTGVDECSVGLATSSHTTSAALGYSSAAGWALWGWGGSGFRNGSLVLSSSAMTNGAVVGFAVDLDNDRLWVSVNGTWLQGNPSAGTSPLSTNLTGTIYPAACPWKNNIITMRFNPAGHSYSPPTGFTAGWTT